MLLFAFHQNMWLDILCFKLNLLNFAKFKLYKLLDFIKLELFPTYGLHLKNLTYENYNKLLWGQCVENRIHLHLGLCEHDRGAPDDYTKQQAELELSWPN